MQYSNSEWVTVGGGLYVYSDWEDQFNVSAMVANGSDIYVAGNFLGAYNGESFLSSPNLIKWNGSTDTWQQMDGYGSVTWSGAQARGSNPIYAIATLDTNVFISGYFGLLGSYYDSANDYNTGPGNGLAHFSTNGDWIQDVPSLTTWNGYNCPVSSGYALVFHHGRLYVGGNFQYLNCDYSGTAYNGIFELSMNHEHMWEPHALSLGLESDGYPGTVYTLSADASSVYAFGAFDTVGGTSQTNGTGATRWIAGSNPDGCEDAVTFAADAFGSSDAVYSPDGINWYASPGLPWSDYWATVAYGNGVFAVNAWGDASAAYSYDGINWLASPGMPFGAYWGDIVYGSCVFASVADGSDEMAYSTNGINWLESSMPSWDNWFCLAYGNDKFVAIANGDSSAAYSYNGSNWYASSAMPYSAAWQSAAYGNIYGGMFVAVAGGSDKCAYSYDGMTWSMGSGLPSDNWASVTYGNGVFVAIACYSDEMAYSTDGVHWAASPMPSGYEWYQSAYGNGVFVTLSQDDGATAHSSDGIHWALGDDLPYEDDTWYGLAACR
jgi:hypothetical protein